MLILLVFLFSKSIFLSISLGTHLLNYLHCCFRCGEVNFITGLGMSEL